MVGTNLKAETLKLMEERDGVEAEVNAVMERLGAAGLSGNLVDSQGFPRPDIDIPAVRAHRRRLAELKKDHKDLTHKIDQNIQLLHAAKPEKHMDIDGQVSPNCNGRVPASQEHGGMRDTLASAGTSTIARIPFAMVDEITESSPAAEDGLQLGDQILKFGSVESGENLLPKLAHEVQINQGSAVPVFVMRQGALTNLSVTPRTWQGRGLLGCHFKLL